VRITIASIQHGIAAEYGLPVEWMREPDGLGSRARPRAHPRQVAMFLAERLSGQPLTDIGRRFGGRDHSTVIHAIRAVEERRKTDPKIDQILRKVTLSLCQAHPFHRNEKSTLASKFGEGE
jgi:chromosomal replication initiator protein